MKVAEIDLVYNVTVKPCHRPKITSTDDSVQLLRSAWNSSKINFIEQFKILLLNASNRVLGLVEISSGGVKATAIDMRLIFAAALKANATAIILSHNHPSGSPTPSIADQQTTERMKLAGNVLDIKVLDHIILTSEGYYSFGDEGML